IKSNKLSDDHEYFAFVKSTKTLISIRQLLKLNHSEDVMILIRSIFENYLSCRYLNKNEEEVDNFLSIPINIYFANYIVEKDGVVVNRDKKEVGKRQGPANLIIGKDKRYYYLFYDFLSTFTHSNFGVAECYLDGNFLFTIEKENY